MRANVCPTEDESAVVQQTSRQEEDRPDFKFQVAVG